jgi:tetratricopeptide (TPR) repeat protein
MWIQPAYSQGLRPPLARRTAFQDESFSIAVGLQDDGKHAEAARLYETLLADGMVAAGLYYNLGIAYARLERYGDAFDATLQAALFDPRNADIRANLAVLARIQNESVPRLLPLSQRELAVISLLFWLLLGIASALTLLRKQTRPILIAPSIIGLFICVSLLVWQVSEHGLLL